MNILSNCPSKLSIILKFHPNSTHCLGTDLYKYYSVDTYHLYKISKLMEMMHKSHMALYILYMFFGKGKSKEGTIKGIDLSNRGVGLGKKYTL